ncbi:transferase [Streptomyces lividans TK24]|nr:transferase [Streptomyces lividans TK24]
MAKRCGTGRPRPADVLGPSCPRPGHPPYTPGGDSHRNHRRRAGPDATAAHARLPGRLATRAPPPGRRRGALRSAPLHQLPAAHPVVAGAARVRRLRLGAARPRLESGPRPRLPLRPRLPAAPAGVDRRGGRPGPLARAGRDRSALRGGRRRGRRRRVEAAGVAGVGGGGVDRRGGGTRACALRGLPLGQDRVRPGGRRVPAARRGRRHAGFSASRSSCAASPSTRPCAWPSGPAAKKKVRRDAAAVALLGVAVPVVGAVAARPLVSDTAEDGTATVAVIQGNVPRAGLGFNAQRRAVLDYHARETQRLADEVKAGKVARPDFVLWPENSSDIDPFANADARLVIDRAAKAVGAPISVGGVVERDGKLLNEQILWDPDKGPVDTYDKRQIQPFGEYLPLRSLIGAINDEWTSMVSRDFSRGTEPGVFTMAGTKVGLVTCYEAAFDWAVRSEVTDGAQMISVPSNNATFDRSEMTYQQLAMSRIRAVEHSRTVTVPVTSGVSAIIMPDGRITQKTGMFVADSLVQEVPLRSSETPATRLGIAPEIALVLVAAGGLGWAVGAGVRGRRARDV